MFKQLDFFPHAFLNGNLPFLILIKSLRQLHLFSVRWNCIFGEYEKQLKHTNYVELSWSRLLAATWANAEKSKQRQNHDKWKVKLQLNIYTVGLAICLRFGQSLSFWFILTAFRQVADYCSKRILSFDSSSYFSPGLSPITNQSRKWFQALR